MPLRSNLPITYRGRSEHSKALRAQKRVVYANNNREKPCAVSGCLNHRHNLSSYCLRHSKRHRRYGRAVGNLPTQGQLRALEGALRDWLEEDHLTTQVDRRGFKADWGSAQRTIRSHPSFALPFFRLEGHEGLTRMAKGWVILSHYYHRQGHSLSDAMLRQMACRLWAEFLWEMPEGKKGFFRERNHFVDTWSGYFVLRNSGFSKTTTEERVVGWEKPWFVSEDPRQNLPEPITEKIEKSVRISDYKAGPIVRAIGKEFREAVDRAMGSAWASDHRLLQRAAEALDLATNHNTSSQIQEK